MLNIHFQNFVVRLGELKVFIAKQWPKYCKFTCVVVASSSSSFKLIRSNILEERSELLNLSSFSLYRFSVNVPSTSNVMVASSLTKYVNRNGF